VRRWPRRGLHSRLTIAVGEVIEPTALEVWLTARWGAHTRKAGQVRPAGDRLRALFSPGVRTRFGRPCVLA
jgi:hypothetical protein